MSSVPDSASSAQRYARAVGILFLISLVAGGFGEFYAPNALIVSGNALATANNVRAHAMLLRAGYAAYMIEAICDITLAWMFYILLQPVHKRLALLAAFFGILSTATFAGTELFYFAPSFILGSGAQLSSFSSAQLDSLALLSFKFYGVGAGIFMAFYGIAWTLRGYLIYRSGYLPRTVGALALIAGAGFILHNFLLVLAPSFRSDFLLAPMFLAALSLAGWLSVKGVDERGWDAAKSLAVNGAGAYE